MAGDRTFVGFGLGPIQAGLMLYEAQRSGNFARYVVAEIDGELVEAVRENGNTLTINIACNDRIMTTMLEDIEVLNPAVKADRVQLRRAIGEADEMATAVPSVALYSAGGKNSISAMLAGAVNEDKPQLLYASENNNYASEILVDEMLKFGPATRFRRLQILNTVIGKMSGVLREPDAIAGLNLDPLTPMLRRAVLVEEFNRILVSRVTVAGASRGIEVFEEKEDLIPFEEAKLFGHNAIHSLLGYLAWRRGYVAMSQIRADQALFELGRKAFVDEPGAALVRKHASTGDPLFTPEGFAAYADDLLERMTNPYLHDGVERICRDPERKLGYGDRLFGTMRECLKQEIVPKLLAKGAYAALHHLVATSTGSVGAPSLNEEKIRSQLERLWEEEHDDGLKERCVELVVEAAKEQVL